VNNQLDHQGFEEVFVTCFPKAKRAALRILCDPVAAEDVAAESLARVYARWATLSGTDYLAAWVVRVATNLALDGLRRRRVWVLPRDPASDRPPLDEQVSANVSLVAALKNLPPRQREIVVLCHLEGFTRVEVSHLLGLSSETVKTHLTRGLMAIRSAIATTEEDTVPWTA